MIERMTCLRHKKSQQACHQEELSFRFRLHDEKAISYQLSAVSCSQPSAISQKAAEAASCELKVTTFFP
jgi:hypothetical protein